MLLVVFFTCIALGCAVGFCAGLLGIGGGLLIVPALVYLLPLLNVSVELVMPIALATSLATIVVTSSAAAMAHHKNKNIPWKLAKQLIIAIGLGALVGAFIADSLSVSVLKNTFAVAVFILSSYMFFSINKQKKNAIGESHVETPNAQPSNIIIKAIGLFTGVLSSLMGIAGGAILVPILNSYSIPLRQCIGVASISGMVVAIFGVSGYIAAGYGISNLPDYSLGYVYLPALLGIILTSSYFAPIGVQWATKLPVTTLKKFFAIFLMLVAIKMIFS